MNSWKIHLLENNAKETIQAWDDYARKHPSGSFYQLSGWKTIFEQVFSFRTFYFYALNDEGRVCGILPTVLLKSIFGQKYLISTPFMSYCGLCADNPDIEVDLISEARRVGKAYGVQYVEFRQLNRLSTENSTKECFVSPMLELADDDELLWKKSLNTKVRNKVRQSIRKGVQIDSGHEYLDVFYQIFSRTMRGLGTPTHPYSLFSEILKVFKDETRILVAKVGETVVAGMILFDFAGRIVHNPWSASLDEYRSLRPNNAMYWEAIKLACQNGFKVFDFGRSTVDTGTYDFKLQWGASAKPLYYQYLLIKTDEFPEFDANNNKYQKVVDIWKRLPYKVTNFFGPRLVRHLPEL